MQDLKAALLRKLLKQKYWGARHTNFNNLPKGFPSHVRKRVKSAAKELIKEGILISKPTSYGLEVSLNPRRRAEVERALL